MCARLRVAFSIINSNKRLNKFSDVRRCYIQLSQSHRNVSISESPDLLLQ